MRKKVLSLLVVSGEERRKTIGKEERKMRKKVLSLLVVSVLVMTSNSWGEEREVFELEEVVVTATRVREKAKDIPVVVDVITEDDIKNTNAETLTEVLSKNTSVDVVAYPGVLSVVNLRGFAPELFTNIKHHALLVNGRRAGAINLSTLLLDDIERIEVLKGPASSLYGSDAMAGVINIITKKSKGKIKTKLGLEGGNFSSWKIGLLSGGAINEKINFDLSFTGLRQGDYDVKEYNIGTWRWKGGRWEGNNYKNYSGSLRTGYNISENQQLNLRYDIFQGKDINFAGDIYGNYGPGKKDLDRYSIDLSYEGETETKNHHWLLKAFIAKDKNLYYSNMDWSTWPPTQVSWYKSFLSYTDYSGLQAQDTLELPFNNQLTIGIDYNQDKTITEGYNPDGSRSSPYRPDNEKINIAGFCENKLSLLGGNFITTLGARYDSYILKTLETPYFANLPYEPGEEKLSNLNPRGGIVYKVKDIARVHSSIGTAFVVPNPYQKAGYYTSWGKITRGNPDLKPENSLSYDAGCEFSISPVNIDITYFHTDIKDKIQSKQVSATETTFENIAKAEISGIEDTVSFDFGKLLNTDSIIKLYLNRTHLLQAKDITNNKDIYNVAISKLNYGVEYDAEKIRGRLNFRYVGGMKEQNWFPTVYVGQSEIEYGDFTIADLNLSYEITKNSTLNFKVNNIFDKVYEEKPGYPMPGRSIIIGTDVMF
ncbi:MAG: TonB-dependent receptor [bacterium]